MQRARDILKAKTGEVWSVPPRATVLEALKIMDEKEIGALMVISDKGKVAGIVTERDYARKIVLKGKSSKDTAVDKIMTPASKMFTVKPDTPVEDCMVLMTAKRVRHLPVFEGNKFLGLVSIGDVVKATISEKDMLIEHLSNYISGNY
ncbi:MAG: CBS domain-containing protein [Deltaproteobacteria bacterium]|jgi:CBS domain-containing protein|nr:CBS domain-containing protein [Deltaproteobacteria bacterium]